MDVPVKTIKLGDERRGIEWAAAMDQFAIRLGLWWEALPGRVWRSRSRPVPDGAIPAARILHYPWRRRPRTAELPVRHVSGWVSGRSLVAKANRDGHGPRSASIRPRRCLQPTDRCPRRERRPWSGTRSTISTAVSTLALSRGLRGRVGMMAVP
jgi:hypothetical protein